MSEPRPLVTLAALRPGYNGQPLLPPLSLALRAGELWALVGRNGGGKTTLMRTMLGLLKPVAGQVVRADAVRVAYVPQRLTYDLSVPTRVADFVAGGVETGWSFLRPFRSAAERDRVTRAMTDTGVHSLAPCALAQLSAGQQQRATLARALVTDPQLLVLDEPTSAMDPMNEAQIFSLLAQIAARRSIAVLVSSHQMRSLLRVADHAVLVDKDLGIAVGGSRDAILASADFHAIYGDEAFAVVGATGDAADQPEADHRG